jgi:hypothetical protein
LLETVRKPHRKGGLAGPAPGDVSDADHLSAKPFLRQQPIPVETYAQLSGSIPQRGGSGSGE